MTVIVLTCVFLVVYHHVLWPLILKRVRGGASSPRPVPDDRALPSVTVVVPAYNEAGVIAGKVRDLLAIHYPAAKLRRVIACDGCSDGTAKAAREAITVSVDVPVSRPSPPHPDPLPPGGERGSCVEVLDFPENRGKVAVLDDVLSRLESDLVAFTDASALVSRDALRRAAAHFNDPTVGVVCGTYEILDHGSEGEAAYWRYQRAVKQGEAALGAPLGAHGAFYVVRRDLIEPLAPDTVNDDFILPMTIVAKGYRAVYDTEIKAFERESAGRDLDFRRRVRIASGNVQQLVRLRRLLHPRFGGIALAFASGKALRAVMPLLLVVSLLGSLALAFSSGFFAVLFTLQALGYAAALLRQAVIDRPVPGPLEAVHYLVVGHLAGLVGVFSLPRGPWRRATVDQGDKVMTFVPKGVRIAKRFVDIVGALAGLVVLAPLLPFLALAIKFDSPGPVFFRQQRIGRALPDRVEVFEMVKFRSMRTDAEAKSGAVWATKGDPRVTRVGRFMRKTRLDELPQLWNVLKGEMSLIGPRPERPGFYAKLEDAIPFFAERTYGLRPGITGLAQVNQGYDRDIEDVRSKVGYDHAYALSLSHGATWLGMDWRILVRTLAVMAGGRGQ